MGEAASAARAVNRGGRAACRGGAGLPASPAMLTNRHRGLAALHNAVALLVVCVGFWLYAELTIAWLSDWMRLTREVGLMPYFLCLVIGMLAGSRAVARTGGRLTRLSGAEAAGLATQQVALVALVVFSMMFATQDRSISRLFLGTFLLGCWALLLWLHLDLPRVLARVVFGRGNRIPTVFVGSARSLPRFQEWLQDREHVGLQAVGFVALDDVPSGSAPPATFLGTSRDLPAIMERFSIGQVVMLELPAAKDRAKAILNLCQERGCRLLIHHDLDEQLEHPLTVVEEDGHQFLALHEEPLEEPLNRLVKRLFDIAVALPVVVLVLPLLCAFVWLMQRIQSPGPLFHTRPRSGEQRTPFAMVKFRTMHVATGDERAEARQATAGDERIYAFGAFLRRHSLDEFPQFWNVLLGQMSVVGPRPVMPLLDEEFERQVRSYRSKHWVKPGITGLAQSRGFRGEIRTPAELQERLRLDLHYIAHWSFWLDVQITVRTAVQIVMPPRSAY